MEKSHINSMFKYLLILCLSFTLLLSQSDKLHMHLEHNDLAISTESIANAHIVGVHPQSTLHASELTNHHHDGHQDKHSAIAVDVSTDKLLKNNSLLDSLVFIISFLVLLLTVPRLRSITRQTICSVSFTSCYYLLQPPLRAPPIK